MGDIVNELLEKEPFACLLYKDQLQIVKNGRPQPSLPLLKSEHKEKNRSYIRSFNVSNYKKYPWLTGSTKSHKLYCWPCLLFAPDRGRWSKTGFDSLNYLVTGCEKHQKSLNHVRAFSTLQTFGRQIVDRAVNLQRKIADSLHYEKVKENRNVLKRLIDIVIFLAKPECALRSHDEFKDFRNKSMYQELVEFLATYDPTIASHLKTATDFKGTSPAIQNDLIDAIASVIFDKIKSEISDATFVAILLDETTDVINKSQLSTTIRFVDNEGNCQERFLNFTDVSKGRTAQGLLQHVTKVVDDLNCSKKLVAQTFDGAVVWRDHVSGLQALVKNKYPSATFIHYHSHKLNLVLSKSTNSIAECRRFFLSLSGICSFFSHSAARTTALRNFTEKMLPGVSPSGWNFSSKFASTVKEYRGHLIKFFSSIEEEPDDWTGEELNIASGFISFLCKLDTKFLLIIFNKIFAFSDVLFDILQNKCMDISYCTIKINEFHSTLQKIREKDFELVWKETISNAEDEYEPRPNGQRYDDCFPRYQRLFREILDTLMSQIKLRFDFQKDLKFVSLLDASNFDTFRQNFPQNLLAELKEPYVSNFDIPRLKNELGVLYTSDDYEEKSIHEITNYMKLNHLDIVFSEVYKLAELILTFPSTTASAERSFCALKRLKNYLRATQGQVQSSNLALISIEKAVLLEMNKWSEEKFYENVILEFVEKERRRNSVSNEVLQDPNPETIVMKSEPESEPDEPPETVTTPAVVLEEKEPESVLPSPKRAKISEKLNVREVSSFKEDYMDIVPNRDEFSTYGEHIANKLRNCGRSRLEITIAQHNIDDICFKLAMGAFANQAFSNIIVPDLHMSSIPSLQVQQPSISSLHVQQPSISSLQLQQPPISSLQLQQPSISSLQMQQPSVSSLQVQQPSVSSLQVQQPSVSSLQVQQPRISSLQVQQQQPSISTLRMHQPSISSVLVQQPSISSVLVQQSSISSPQVQQPSISSPQTSNSPIDPNISPHISKQATPSNSPPRSPSPIGQPKVLGYSKANN